LLALAVRSGATHALGIPAITVPDADSISANFFHQRKTPPEKAGWRFLLVVEPAGIALAGGGSACMRNPFARRNACVTKPRAHPAKSLRAVGARRSQRRNARVANSRAHRSGREFGSL